jgi:hypothetical protein
MKKALRITGRVVGWLLALWGAINVGYDLLNRILMPPPH